jgi:hypothetical protein
VQDTIKKIQFGEIIFLKKILRERPEKVATLVGFT